MKNNQNILNEEQMKVFKNVEESNNNIFITGAAGTGKSELLKYMISHTKKTTIVLAPTGVAAINVGGQTIHSFFHLDRDIQRTQILRNKNIDENLQKILISLDTIIIDEISMVKPDVIDAIDFICKKVRNINESFGGIQLVCFGDLYQLPPVIESSEVNDYFIRKYGGVYFFNAKAFKNYDFIYDNTLKMYELHHIFRQKDEEFKNALNEIRINKVSKKTLDIINSRVTQPPLDDEFITLATTNKIVNDVNEDKLSSLKGGIVNYTGKITGSIQDSDLETDKVLKLKVGAKVMMLNNDFKKRWVNGDIGIVSSLKPDVITVVIRDKPYDIEKYKWDKYKYTLNNNGSIDRKLVGTFEQFPLKLAWAITIHKSQGKTYNSIFIDFGDRAFVEGQVYVALSRCTTLQTLYLKRPLRYSDIMVSNEVINFMSKKKKEEN